MHSLMEFSFLFPKHPPEINPVPRLIGAVEHNILFYTNHEKAAHLALVCERMAPPAASITHSPSVTGRRVQVIHHNRISQEAFKHCKGSTRQEDCDKSKHLGVQL